MKKNIYSLVFLTSLAFIGCTKSDTIIDYSLDYSVAKSKLTRDLNPSVSQTELTELASKNNDFAFDMFSKLHTSEGGNIFFSPYSISEALAMTYAGAKGDTKTQMAGALHFTADDTALHNSFNALDLHLNHSEDNYRFSVANSLWAQKDYKFLDSYLDTIKVNYGADVSLLNFAESEKSREIINTWVEDKTEQRIKDLIPSGVLTPHTKLVLTNAVYFKGQWVNEFEESATKEGTFTSLDGTKKQTPFMSQSKEFFYSENTNYQAVNLPYVGDRTSMVVVLPKNGKFQEVISDMKNVYQDISQNLSSKGVALKMPKFEFTTGVYELSKHFIALGMVDAFDNGADFSGMTGDNDLMIKSILHKAFIKVDETGTEAAAATAVVAKITFIGGPRDPIEMLINRPFIFFIKDVKSGQVLFMGVVKEI